MGRCSLWIQTAVIGVELMIDRLGFRVPTSIRSWHVDLIVPSWLDGKNLVEKSLCGSQLGYLMAVIFDGFRKTDALKAVS